jgi:hypothetical protein
MKKHPQFHGFLLKSVLTCACLSGFSLAAAHAQSLGDIFVIDMENQNWVQPDGNVASVTGTTYNGGSTSSGGIQQIFANPAAPYINSLVTPGNANAAEVSFASNYYNVLATPTGANPSIHPSEPNYLWQEAGTNYNTSTTTGANNGVNNDNNPYGSGGNVAVIAGIESSNPSINTNNLSNMLQTAGISWKSYQEDTDLATTGLTDVNGNQAGYDGTLTGNALTSTPVAANQKTVPLASFSGTSTNYTNPYNGSHQYNFASKHDGTLFYAATSGGNNATSSNPLASNYAPLQQLTTDLANNTVGKYNLITPDQYNDMHTALSGGFTYNGIHFTGDAAQIAQGDNFLSIIVPQIMASQAFQNNGAIVIWTDETEPDSTNGTTGDLNQNDYNHTLMEIVISPLAKGNGYSSSVIYTHSSDVKTLQEIYGVSTGTGNGFLNDAGTAGTNDLSNLFVAGAVPQGVPEPASLSLIIGTGLLALFRRRRA